MLDTVRQLLPSVEESTENKSNFSPEPLSGGVSRQEAAVRLRISITSDAWCT